MNTDFPLIMQYLSIRLDCDLVQIEPGQLTLVETSRRLQREASYGYIRVCWWLYLHDGRSVISVPPGTEDAIRKIVGNEPAPDMLFDPTTAERLREAINPVLARHGMIAIDRVFTDRAFACDAEGWRQHAHGECRRLSDEFIPPAEGLRLPTHYFPDGTVYGVIADGQVAAYAFVHRGLNILEDRIADIGVVTAPAYRRLGYAQTAVSAVVEQITRTGGEAWYCCSPENLASAATARSVGFIEYGASLLLGAPVEG